MIMNSRKDDGSMSELPEEKRDESGPLRKKRERKKPSRQEYVIPDGKLQTHETPGFDIKKHKQVDIRDFADPLDYYKWLKWFHQQHITAIDIQIDELASMGFTPIERAFELEIQKAKKRIADLEKKKQEEKEKAEKAEKKEDKKKK